MSREVLGLEKLVPKRERQNQMESGHTYSVRNPVEWKTQAYSLGYDSVTLLSDFLDLGVNRNTE